MSTIMPLAPEQLAALIEQKMVLAIMGPTASGKSRLSMALSEVLPIEIISVDSALIYRGMDIGTAKPTTDEMTRVPHHLIDILDPAESYSAADFVADTHRLVGEIFARGHLPVLVGGTMMYFHALQQGMAQLPSADEMLREKIHQAWLKDAEAVHNQLKSVDPVAAEKIHKNDPQRLIRALEVFELTGKPLSQLQQEQSGQALSAFSLKKIALMPGDRAGLHALIEQRFLQMLEAGFLGEVKHLKARGDLHAELPSIRSVGYRQAWQFLEGEWDYDTFVQKGITATRQLAKRQITWLRKETHVLQLDPQGFDLPAQVRQVMAYLA